MEPPAAEIGRRALLARNGAANLLRAASGSAINVMLPLILVGMLHKESYATWALVFSIAGYVLFFELGMPSTVQVFVARAAVARDFPTMRAASMAGIRISASVAAACTGLSVAVAVTISSALPAVPVGLRADASMALVVLTVGQGANLVSNVAAAYFAGDQRSGIATGVIVPARFASLFVATVIAVFGGGLGLVAVGFSVPMVAAPIFLLTRILRETQEAGAEPSSARRGSDGGRLLRYSGPLVFWGVCMLLATGSGVLIVSRFAPDYLFEYSIAMVLYTALAGFMGAVAAPLLPELSRMKAPETEALQKQILLATRVHSAILHTTLACLIALAPIYLAYAMRNSPANSGHAFLAAGILVTAGAVHLAASPLSFGFVATGRHHRVVASPLVEGLSTVGLGVALAPAYGAVGVALAVLIGALFGLVLTCYWSIRRVGFAELRGGVLVEWMLGVPIVGVIFVYGAVGLTYALALPTLVDGVVIVTSVAGALAWEYFVVVPADERHRLTARIAEMRTLQRER